MLTVNNKKLKNTINNIKNMWSKLDDFTILYLFEINAQKTLLGAKQQSYKQHSDKFIYCYEKYNKTHNEYLVQILYKKDFKSHKIIEAGTSCGYKKIVYNPIKYADCIYDSIYSNMLSRTSKSYLLCIKYTQMLKNIINFGNTCRRMRNLITDKRFRSKFCPLNVIMNIKHDCGKLYCIEHFIRRFTPANINVTYSDNTILYKGICFDNLMDLCGLNLHILNKNRLIYNHDTKERLTENILKEYLYKHKIRNIETNIKQPNKDCIIS